MHRPLREGEWGRWAGNPRVPGGRAAAGRRRRQARWTLSRDARGGLGQLTLRFLGQTPSVGRKLLLRRGPGASAARWLLHADTQSRPQAHPVATCTQGWTSRAAVGEEEPAATRELGGWNGLQLGLRERPVSHTVKS